MKIRLNIGDTSQLLEMDDENVLGVLHANPVPHGRTGAEEVRYALEHPIGTGRLNEIVQPGETVAIITSDITRPMPTWEVMPVLLEELHACGIQDKDITLIFALGSHRKQTKEEQSKLAGEAVSQKIRCLDSDQDDVVHVGITSRGTPVDLFRPAVEADRLICLGNIEYHYFAGYSGGAKAVMPGISTWQAIQSNHRMMVREEAHAGNLDTNPVRQDIEEAGKMTGIDFILNVVLDEQHRILRAFAGDAVQAHCEGCRYLDQLYQIPIAEKADIVVVSQGGSPKDINLYQTQKALDNAAHAVKDSGTIILVGSCREGYGNPVFEEWLLEAEKPQDLIDHLNREFRLGGHKAAAIALVEQKASIYLVSDMAPAMVRHAFMKPFDSVQSAFDAALAEQGKQAKVLIMPYGGSTLPVLVSDQAE